MISVLIVTYNSEACVGACIEALTQWLPDSQVLVIDNASTDRSRELAERHGATVLALDKNVGFGRACNIGVHEADYEHILLLNPDVAIRWADPTGLAELLQATNLGLVVPVSEHSAFTFRERPWVEETLWHTLGTLWPREFARRNLAPRDDQELWLSGAALLVRKAEFLGFDGFDTRYFLYYEDRDLSHRYRSHGLPLRTTPTLVADHVGGGSSELDDRRSDILAFAIMGWLQYRYNIGSSGAATQTWRLIHGVQIAATWLVGGAARIFPSARLTRKSAQLKEVAHELRAICAASGVLEQSDEHSYWPDAVGMVDQTLRGKKVSQHSSAAIGLVSPLPPQLGGVVTVARWLLDHESDIGCSYVTFDLERPTAEAGGRIRANTVGDQLKLLARFLPWARRSPRVVHCMVSPTLTGLSRDTLYLAILVLHRKRAVAHVHIVRPEVLWWRLAMRLVGQFAAEVVVLGTAGQVALEGLDVAARVVPNAIPFPSETLPARPESPSSGPVRLLFAGTFGERKGCHELIKAMAILRNEGLDCHLDMVGREEYAGEEARLRREVETNKLDAIVNFIGQRSSEELAALYADSDAFCLPSHLEGLPLALIEAMAYGLPAIATPVGCVEDLVIDGDTGLLARTGDPISLAGQLSRLIRDPQLRRTLGESGARHVAAHMGQDVVAGAWREIYASAAA
jgi:glycosyltransferase involved in cell wall biosynthesis/GT2 family glycosyltransferase